MPYYDAATVATLAEQIMIAVRKGRDRAGLKIFDRGDAHNIMALALEVIGKASQYRGDGAHILDPAALGEDDIKDYGFLPRAVS